MVLHTITNGRFDGTYDVNYHRYSIVELEQRYKKRIIDRREASFMKKIHQCELNCETLCAVGS
jgi:hypothetical protein